MTARKVAFYGLGLFVLLSLADFALTLALLLNKPGAYEANPVAAAWLDKYGWRGLAGFKTLSVLVVAVALGMVSWRRPRLGAVCVVIACLALLAVAVYSRYLMTLPDPPRPPVPQAVG